MRSVALIGASLLFGCGQASKDTIDCDALLQDEAIVDRCFGGDVTGQYIGIEECYPFSDVRQYQGVLVTGFESSILYPDAQSYSETDRQNPTYWFRPAPDTFTDNHVDRSKCTYDCAFAVSFMGRETVCEYQYGHLNAYPKMIIGESSGSIRQLNVTSDD
ncbi:hypothetical protein [Qipengyuania sp. DGS5-3]|uniref:hypothetical protein n=1 Tax=Qipengyuania sp. DGS5-3 TaxID=3349632 RepID=UPI0036D3EBD4